MFELRNVTLLLPPTAVAAENRTHDEAAGSLSGGVAGDDDGGGSSPADDDVANPLRRVFPVAEGKVLLRDVKVVFSSCELSSESERGEFRMSHNGTLITTFAVCVCVCVCVS